MSAFEKNHANSELISRVLGSLYKEGAILAKRVEYVSNEKGEKTNVTFVFPKYDRTIKDLGHVSMVQIHAALLEGAYLVCGRAIEKGQVVGITFEDFVSRMSDAIYLEEGIKFRKMLHAESPVKLTFQIVESGNRKLKREFVAATIQVNGAVRGRMVCLLPK